MACPIKMDGLGKTINLANDNRCLKCNELLDAATPVGEDAAKPDGGDISMCAFCGHVMAFTDDATLRELTEEEKAIAFSDPQRGRTRGMN